MHETPRFATSASPGSRKKHVSMNPGSRCQQSSPGSKIDQNMHHLKCSIGFATQFGLFQHTMTTTNSESEAYTNYRIILVILGEEMKKHYRGTTRNVNSELNFTRFSMVRLMRTSISLKAIIDWKN